PLLRIPGVSGLMFFTKQEYQVWREKAIKEGGQAAKLAEKTPLYFKGLGTSSKENVGEDYRSGRSMLVIQDKSKKAQEALDLAFNKLRTDDRKDWMSRAPEGEFLETRGKTLEICDLINT